MHRIFFTFLLFAGCGLAGAELSKAASPAIRGRENFYIASLTPDQKEKAEYLLAALADDPRSDLYFQELSRCSLEGAARLRAGKQLLEMAKKYPELEHFVMLGIHWSHFSGMSSQEILDILEPVLDRIKKDNPAVPILFNQKLHALREMGDFSSLKDLVHIRDRKLLIPIAYFAYAANFFEPEKYKTYWETIQKNLKQSENNDPEYLFELESFYFALNDYDTTRRLRRLRIPAKNGILPSDELKMEITLLVGQKKFDEAYKVLDSQKKSNPELCKKFTAVVKSFQEAATPKPAPVIQPEKLLPQLNDPKEEVRLSAGYQLLIHAEKERDTALYSKVREKLLPLAKNADLLNAIGYIGVELGVQLAENRKLIEKALEQDPRNYAFLDSLAWAQFRQGEFKKAAKTVRKALYSVPVRQDDFDNLGVIFMHAGDIEMALNNPSGAIKFYRRALQCVNDKELDFDAVKKKLKKAEAAK